MHRYFSAEQFNMQADVLLNQGDAVGVLPRVMHRDLRFDFDELEQLREMLVASWTGISKELDVCHDRETKQMLEERQSQLENMIERITESFVMP